jgi:hypothetical protein
MEGVEIRGVASVCVLEGEEERICQLRNRDQMDVVRHEVVANQGEAMNATPAAQKVEADEAVGIGIEDDLTAIASLGDVVRRTDCNNASETGHDERKCGIRWILSGKRPVCPRFPRPRFPSPVSVCPRFPPEPTSRMGRSPRQAARPKLPWITERCSRARVRSAAPKRRALAPSAPFCQDGFATGGSGGMS